MVYTIVYTEAPRCSYCKKPMREWTAFAETHYHDECWLRMLTDKLEKLRCEMMNVTALNKQPRISRKDTRMELSL